MRRLNYENIPRGYGGWTEDGQRMDRGWGGLGSLENTPSLPRQAHFTGLNKLMSTQLMKIIQNPVKSLQKSLSLF